MLEKNSDKIAGGKKQQQQQKIEYLEMYSNQEFQ